MASKGSKYLKKVNTLNSKIMKKKIKPPFMIYTDFESILVQKIMESKMQMNLIRANIKNILLEVMAIN